jgi:hypothetical protein
MKRILLTCGPRKPKNQPDASEAGTDDVDDQKFVDFRA